VIALYMDHNVPRAITVGLRLRGVDVITAYEDGADDMDDSALLDRATELGRVLFTHDDDLLAETTKRQQEDIPSWRGNLCPPNGDDYRRLHQ